MTRVLTIPIILACISGGLLGQVRSGGGGMGVQGDALRVFQDKDDTRSVFLAVTLSLIVPGLGEWYAGNPETGRYFMAADGALWLTFGAFTFQGDWIRDDARTFASRHSGAQFAGKDDQFGVDIGNFSSTEEYNQEKLRNREFELIYTQSGYQWNWDTDASRLQYRSFRISSDRMFQNARFVVGMLVVNRIVSAFSAWRSAARHNKGLASDGAWRFEAEVQGRWPYPHGFGIKVSHDF